MYKKIVAIGDQHIPYLDMDVHKAFIKFLKDFKPKFLEIEGRLFSPTYLYAGTPDRIAMVQSVKTILDIKTGSEIYPGIRLQLAGYQGAYNEMNPKDKAKNRLVVKLMPDKYQAIPLKDQSSDWYDFVAALRVAQFKQKNRLIKE